MRKTGDQETQSVPAVPLMGSCGALGLIYAGTHRRRRVFDELDIEFVTMVSRLLADRVSVWPVVRRSRCSHPAARSCLAAGRALGEVRFVDALCDGFGQPASAALDEPLADRAAFLKNGRSPADITISLVHRVPAAPA